MYGTWMVAPVSVCPFLGKLNLHAGTAGDHLLDQLCSWCYTRVAESGDLGKSGLRVEIAPHTSPGGPVVA